MPRNVLRLTGLGCLAAAGSAPVARSLESQELPVFGTGVTVVTELLDPAGRARGLPLAGPPLVVPDADGLERYVLTLAPREVPPGRHALRVRFRDPATGATARSELAVRIE